MPKSINLKWNALLILALVLGFSGTGLAQEDLTQYGFGPEGMFFGEGVYAQEGGPLGSVAHSVIGGNLERRQQPVPYNDPFQGAGKGVQESVGIANTALLRADRALDTAGEQVGEAMGTLSPSRRRRPQTSIGGKGGRPYVDPRADPRPARYLQEGGILEESSFEGVQSLPEGGADAVALQVTQEAVDAVRGEHPQPEVAIESFVAYFGPEAFDALRTLVIQEESARRIGGPDGLIAGEDGGRDDIQRGNILNGDFPDQEINFSGGEYIFSADDVALMGDGNTEAGARRLDNARANLRKKATGTTERPSYMGEGAAEEILEEAMVG